MEQKDVHLKMNMKFMLYVGAYRFNFNNRLVNVAYRAYSTFIKSYFVMFVITEHLELITMPDKGLMNVISILAVSLIYSTGVWKMVICNGKSVRKLVKQLRDMETEFLSWKNKDLEDIYYKHVKDNYFCSWFLLIGNITSSLYYIKPSIDEKSTDLTYMNVTKNNYTEQYRIRLLPLQSWFPFNRYKYYYFSFGHQVFATIIGGTMVVLTDLLFVALMIFIIGQLKVLQYNFKNSKKLAQNVQIKRNISYDEAVRYTIHNCVNKHKIIIQ